MTSRPKIGIMQGRLSQPIENKIQCFPQNTWREEFNHAADCGFNSIEWIFDLYDNNPIMDNLQISEIKSLSDKYDIAINSVCADYFMEKKIFNESETNMSKNLDILQSLIEKCYKIGISIIEIPLVDSSSLKTQKDKETLVHNLNKILPYAKDCNVYVALETDLPPQQFDHLLSRFNLPDVFANYDTGNSTALGYDAKEELSVLSNKIKNIHIKDRLFHGKTVPLGTGNTNFDSFFSNLQKIGYKGDLIIQGAREENISPKATCMKYYGFVKQYVDKYFP